MPAILVEAAVPGDTSIVRRQRNGSLCDYKAEFGRQLARQPFGDVRDHFGARNQIGRDHEMRSRQRDAAALTDFGKGDIDAILRAR